MWHIGVDLHRHSLTLAAVNDTGEVRPPVRVECLDTASIVAAVTALTPFRVVVEATSHYRWLYDLLSPYGRVLLAHPQRLRALTLRRSKTDRLDSQLLAQLLRLDQIPLAYVPAPRFQTIRELTRHRGRFTHFGERSEQVLKSRNLIWCRVRQRKLHRRVGRFSRQTKDPEQVVDHPQVDVDHMGPMSEIVAYI